jgi:hypothetical protein
MARRPPPAASFESRYRKSLGIPSRYDPTACAEARPVNPNGLYPLIKDHLAGGGIPSGGVAPPLNTPGMRGRRALPAGRRAPRSGVQRIQATGDFSLSISPAQNLPAQAVRNDMPMMISVSGLPGTGKTTSQASRPGICARSTHGSIRSSDRCVERALRWKASITKSGKP